MALLVIDKGAETVLRYTKPKCLLHRPDAASPFRGSVTNERIRKKAHICATFPPLSLAKVRNVLEKQHFPITIF